MKRKLISLLTLVSILFCSATMNVCATDINPNALNTRRNSNIIIMRSNAANVSMKLSFSGTTASCYSNIIGQTGTTSISGRAELRRLYPNNTYDVVKSWTGLSATRILTINKTATVTKGYTYEFAIIMDIVRNGESETVYFEKENDCM